jgi:hypothetical protein
MGFEDDALPEATEDTETVQPAKNTAGLLKTLGSTFTITIAVFYAVGVIVTNAYLLSIDVTDFNVFKSRCVLTGTWATVMIICVALPGFLYYRTLTREGSRFKKQHLAFITTLPVLCYFVFRIVCETIGIASRPEIAVLFIVGTVGF